MPEPARLIKKYPNRRLYDTKTSVYITLADVKKLVVDGEEFQVVDAKTGEVRGAFPCPHCDVELDKDKLERVFELIAQKLGPISWSKKRSY